MAEFTGVNKAKAEEILGMSVVSGTVPSSGPNAGHLILYRENGQSIDAGDFTAIMTSLVASAVNTAVASAVPAKVAGTTVNKGNVSGNVSFTEFNNDNLVNALVTLTATGAIAIAAANLPSAPKANTQFAVRITQDATGGRVLTLSGFKKSNGILTLSTAANAVDILVFFYDGTSWYAGLMGVDFK